MFLKTARKRLLQLRFEYKASHVFSSFRNQYFSLSKRCTTLDDFRSVSAKYDTVICGSDQVWVFKRPSAYFLDLGEKFKGLKISYATCCGHNQQQERKNDEIRKLVNGLDFISVRNNFSREIISSLTNKPIAVVADPTLLIEFNEIMEKRSLPCSQYILMYSLSEDVDGTHQKIIQAIKKKIGDLPVVSVVANSSPQKSKYAKYHIFDVSPQQWIWLIANASFVYTDSFHGALFCIKYNRLFIVDCKEKWRSLRLLDAAERYGFESNIAYSVDDAIVKLEDFDRNYENTHTLIAQHVEESQQFLKKVLN